MNAYRTQTTLTQDGTLVLKELPFHAGDRIDVLVTPHGRTLHPASYSLRGTPIEYRDPTKPVAQEDWEAAH